MLYCPNIPPDASQPRVINGHKLARNRNLTPTHRALLAIKMETGEVQPSHLTRRQARALTGASAGYVATLARATVEQRDQVARGLLSLSALHNQLSTDVAAIERAINRLERAIDKLGIEHVRAKLDRIIRAE